MNEMIFKFSNIVIRNSLLALNNDIPFNLDTGSTTSVAKFHTFLKGDYTRAML